MDKPITSDYLLLFRGTQWHRNMSPEQIQETMTAWTGWFDGLVAEGRCKGGHPLEQTGAVVSSKGGIVSDGPFTESKEAIGGYFYLQVGSLEEAIEIAHRCPALEHGMTVEVRPVMPTCAASKLLQEAEERLAMA